ncbi:hypothetical protein GCM10007938_41160 [Vibrio zhanjiangensis]|uniref:Uncharacterized protein n=1 Tax=Vibrio zhanjiangensis TaxID=1046128 RepID=A0ABQ6F475_9VIBR|nr:hypothetical protein [Vibrio zhanjiangensis]GLT20332.1 hypothetical protein GCM10007938_41160 [Vibrio zhanjiangensis]
MHIVEAFEQAQTNQADVQRKINALMMELAQNQTPETLEVVKRLNDINADVSNVLRPFTD